MPGTNRRLLYGLIVMVLLAAAAWLARPAYHRYKEARSLQRARAFLKNGELREAIFSLRQTLAIDSTNIEAVVLTADILANAGSPGALPYRQRAAELSPTTENKLLL